jgi:DNA-binding transcriptional regulator/RsmH inhibitor MraZ
MSEQEVTSSAGLSPRKQRVFRTETVSVDDKGRVLLNKEFVAVLGETVALVARIPGVLALYSQPGYENLVDDFYEEFSDNNEDANLYREVYLAKSRSELKIDNGGRLLIPADFRTMAGIKNKCVIVANGTQFNIYSEDAHKEFEQDEEAFARVKKDRIERLRKKALEYEQEKRNHRLGIR